MAETTKFVRMRFTNADELAAVCDAYFKRIDEMPEHVVNVGSKILYRKVPYTPAGLARSLGISTQTLGKYLRGEVAFPDKMSDATQSKILHVLTDARMKIEDDISTKALLNEVDNTVAKQVLGVFGYNKCLDDAGEEANNKVLVLVEGASRSQIENWGK